MKENKGKNNHDKQIVIEEVISNAIKLPGVKVNRNSFLMSKFDGKVENIQNLLEKGPVEAGVTREEINKIAKKLILERTSQSSMASFVAGIPGGIAIAATIPADILQFFGMTLKLAQELSYLYGAEDLWCDGEVDDEKVRRQLILYCGVMFGVSSAVSGLRVLSAQISKTALKKIPQQALTKHVWYRIIKKIGTQLSVTITKKTFANGVAKIVPVIGGVISGTLNFASMMPMANRLNVVLDKASFDYNEEDLNRDIEILVNDDSEKQENESEELPPPIPTEKYYVVINGESKGPYDIKELEGMIEKQKIKCDDLIWKKGMKEWKAATKFKELEKLFLPPIPHEN